MTFIADPRKTQARDFDNLIKYWRDNPVGFVMGVLGAIPDPWQADVLDAIATEDNVAIRSCHGVGKTTILSWTILWFVISRPWWVPKTTLKVFTTAPTFGKQVRDVLWSEVHKWWTPVEGNSPWLYWNFEMQTVEFRLRQRPLEWFAVGKPSSEAINVEGYHADYLLAVFDEAKGIRGQTWTSVMGMGTTQKAKWISASTPGACAGEFYKVFTKSDYRSTWKTQYIIRPFQVKEEVQEPEVVPSLVRPALIKPDGKTFGKVLYAGGGTWYSRRVRDEFVIRAREIWGKDHPAYIARVQGNFPETEGDALIPYRAIAEAEDREIGVLPTKPGYRVVSCDVATFGRDRTVMFVMEGGTVLHGEVATSDPKTSTIEEVKTYGVGNDPKHPLYREAYVIAEALIRLRRQWKAELIIVDDTGVGQAVTTVLRQRGEHFQRFVSGASPTDKPKTPQAKEYKLFRDKMESSFTNLKAEAAWALRAAFVNGHIALGQLPSMLLEPLIEQCSLVKKDQKEDGRLFIVDPDQDEDQMTGLTEEGKKSPDHFHSLMMGWWAASGAAVSIPPKARSVIPGITKIGRPVGGGTPIGAGAIHGTKTQVEYIDKLYRR